LGRSDRHFKERHDPHNCGIRAGELHAAFRSFDLRLAAIIGSGIFMLGAAGGHVYQMVTAHNFAPGNAGIIFWSGILLFAPLWAQRRLGRDGRAS
jgi:hypothetical protein